MVRFPSDISTLLITVQKEFISLSFPEILQCNRKVTTDAEAGRRSPSRTREASFLPGKYSLPPQFRVAGGQPFPSSCRSILGGA